MHYRKLWIQANGPIPKDINGRSYEIHHKNNNHNDNRLENLRWATICENNQNQSVYTNNKLKEQYICKHVDGYYRFQRTINYKRIEKYFKTLQEAIDYRLLFTAS